MPSEKTNSSGAAGLQEAVKGNLFGRVRNFQLIIESDGVVLRGQARSYHAKQLAQHLVMELSTLRILANEIDVVNGGEA